MIRRITLLFYIGLIFSCNNYINKLSVCSLFSNGMVLQRNTMVNIWGESLPNREIKINCEWGEELILQCENLKN